MRSPTDGPKGKRRGRVPLAWALFVTGNDGLILRAGLVGAHGPRPNEVSTGTVVGGEPRLKTKNPGLVLLAWPTVVTGNDGARHNGSFRRGSPHHDRRDSALPALDWKMYTRTTDEPHDGHPVQRLSMYQDDFGRRGPCSGERQGTGAGPTLSINASASLNHRVRLSQSPCPASLNHRVPPLSITVFASLIQRVWPHRRM